MGAMSRGKLIFNISQLPTGSYEISGSFFGTSSWAQSASYALQSISASFALTASRSLLSIDTASVNNATITFTKGNATTFPITINNVVNATSASFATNSTTATSASFALTASYAMNGGQGGTFPFSGSAVITGSLYVSGSGITGSLSGTASVALTAQTASYVLNSVSSSFATTASYVVLAQTASFVTASNVIGTVTSASFAVSASYILNAISSSQSVSSSYALSASYSVTSSYSNTSTSASHAVNANNAATASNILGGIATHVPYFITDTTLATSSIYQSGSSTVIINQDNATTANPEALYVFQPNTSSINVISGKGNLNNYLQLNIQNTNQGTQASSDVVATANNGNETVNYIDMGINSENYSQNFIGAANDAYLYSIGNDLHIGNAAPNRPLQFFAGGTDVDIYNKLQLNPNNQHLMSGSLDVSGSIKAFSFTGSLQGNATSATTSQTSSYSTTLGASLSQPANNQVRLLNSAGGTLSTVTVNNVTSASYADNAATANYATTAGNGGVTQIIAGSGITLIPPGGQGAVTVIASGGGGVTIISGSLVTGSFTNTTSFTFNHNLSTRTPIITVFDSNYNQIIPQNIELVNTASAVITFPTPESGFAIGSTGGTTGTALSSSYALFAEYANTASFYAETDPIFVAKSASLATTGSNVFRGNQIVTGSLFTTGSNTLIGSTTLTGSLSISGSTTQTGNNILIGTTTLTGSIFINGNIIPQLSSSFDLGSITNPWRALYVQSGSISIQSDIPGGIPAVISNANGNVTFAGAGFQLKSGSFVPFEISSSARTIIRVPDIPANDVGGLSIIGSSTGVYQGVTNAGGLLHLTSNDGQSSRITSDAYGINSVVAYVGRKARGTAASPLPVQSGDTLTRISTIGWTGPEYGFLMSASSTIASTAIETVALENFTTSSFGTRHTFYNAPLGGTLRTLSAQIDTTGITIPSTSKFFGTASWANNAQTASYVTSSNIVGTVLSSSYALTASYAPSYVLTSSTSSMLTPYVLTSSTGSMLQPYVLSSATSSFVTNSQTGSFATTGSNRFNGNQTISGSLLVSGSTTHTGSLLITGSTTHVGSVTVTGSVNISGSIIMDGTAQSLVIKTSVTNPSALAIHTFPTASYSGANYNFVVIEDSTKKSTTYNILVAQGNNKVAEIKTYLIKSEGSSPNPTIATAINAGNVELRVTDTGTFTYRGIVQLF